MIGWRTARLVALGVMLALAGCKTVENSLSQNDVSAMKLAGVTVRFAPDAAIQWEDGIRAYAVAKSIPDDQIATAANTPEANAFVQNRLGQRIKIVLEQKVGPQLTGTRPVRLEIVVKHFAIASAVQSVLIGGGRGMRADATLVDARTGAVIISHPDMAAVMMAGSGIVGTAVQAAVDASSKDSVADKLVAQYGDIYCNWLLQRGA
jgi:hypothetical protein